MPGEFEAFLSKRHESILRKWREAVLSSYPEETQRFFKKDTNPFTNPVGHVMDVGLANLLDALLTDGAPECVSAPVEEIVRVRAVQDFTPSQALAFLFALKGILRDEVEGAGLDVSLVREGLQAWDRRIDALALLGFDLYEACRRRLYMARAEEIKNQVGGLLRRANLAAEIPGL